MSRQSAYRLRSRLKGQAFDLAWDVAFHHSYDNLAHAALERALNGVEVPVFRGGEQVGSYRKYDERLTLMLLRMKTRPGGPAPLGRHHAEAGRHAARFEALVAEIEAGEGGEAPVADPGVAAAESPEPAHPLDLPPLSNAQIMAQLRRFGGYR